MSFNKNMKRANNDDVEETNSRLRQLIEEETKEKKK